MRSPMQHTWFFPCSTCMYECLSLFMNKTLWSLYLLWDLYFLLTYVLQLKKNSYDKPWTSIKVKLNWLGWVLLAFSSVIFRTLHARSRLELGRVFSFNFLDNCYVVVKYMPIMIMQGPFPVFHKIVIF